MKSILKSVILVCAMAATSFAAAASFTVKGTKSNIFKVQYMSEQKGTVAVSILNNKNEVVFEEQIISNGSFIRPYNFSNLTEGEYTIVIKDANGEQRQVVNYITEKIISYTYMAQIPGQESKYWLNVQNNGEEKLNVRIYSQKGDLLFEQAVVVSGQHSSVFNLSQVNQTPVTFEVTNGTGKVFTTSFN